MKIIITPIFRVLTVTIYLPIIMCMFVIAWVLYFIWNFKPLPYGEFFTNEGSTLLFTKPRRDKNLGETISRFWNFDFY
jgi:hypothetical protein